MLSSSSALKPPKWLESESICECFSPQLLKSTSGALCSSVVSSPSSLSSSTPKTKLFQHGLSCLV